MRSLFLLPMAALASPVLQQIPLVGQPQASESRTTAHSWLEHPAQLEQHIQSLPQARLVRYVDSTGQLATQQITEGEKALFVYHGIKFEDVTDELDISFAQPSELPATLAYSAEDLKPVFKAISTDRMERFLTEFSGFRTRYYRSEDGKKSQKWLKEQLLKVVGDRKDISVQEFEHPWGQNSLILHWDRRTTAATKDHPDEVVIIAAHQDSTNLLPFLPAPGADDDGSGTTSLFEILNVLLEADFVPKNSSVEFHWYSAEEGGLLGSQAVAQAYHAAGRAVKSMLQLDMTAYVKPGTEERIGIITDFVDSDLTSLLNTVAKEYAEIPAVPTKCGYACSDHASWSKVGVRSAFSIEATFEDSNTGHIHSTGDKISVPGFSFSHMAQFVRLGAAYLKELSG